MRRKGRGEEGWTSKKASNRDRKTKACSQGAAGVGAKASVPARKRESRKEKDMMKYHEAIREMQEAVAKYNACKISLSELRGEALNLIAQACRGEYGLEVAKGITNLCP